MIRELAHLAADLDALDGDPATLTRVRELLAGYGLIQPVTVAELARQIDRSPRLVRRLAVDTAGELEGVHIPDDYLFSTASAAAVVARYRTNPPKWGRRPRKPA